MGRYSNSKGNGFSARCLKNQLTVAPSNSNVNSEAGTTTFTINSNSTWSVSENVSWLTVTPLNGSGSDTLTVNYDANVTIETRVGQISLIAGSGLPIVNFTLTQSGALPYLTVNPVNQNVSSSSGEITVSVNSNTSWNVTENVYWFSVIPMSGSNNGTLTISYDTNTNTEPRFGQITISTDDGLLIVYVTVSQDAAPPSLTVTPSNQYIGSTAGITDFSISSNTLWTVSESIAWLTVTPLNGSGDGTLIVEYDNNPNTETRIGIITISAVGELPSVDVTVTQSGYFPCGTPLTDIRDGKIYSTIQIGTQCWMAQNLNIGTRINSSNDQTNNGIIEKYCQNNSEANCTVYGGLYQWDEMMGYTTIPGAQGICPEGWHLPTHAEWIALITYVSSQPAYICGGNSTYIAKAMAAKTNWNPSSYFCAVGNNLTANNATGFTAMPGGSSFNGFFLYMGECAFWWSSSQHDASNAWWLGTAYYLTSPGYDFDIKSVATSVRCVKD